MKRPLTRQELRAAEADNCCDDCSDGDFEIEFYDEFEDQIFWSVMTDPVFDE